MKCDFVLIILYCSTFAVLMPNKLYCSSKNGCPPTMETERPDLPLMSKKVLKKYYIGNNVPAQIGTRKHLSAFECST